MIDELEDKRDGVDSRTHHHGERIRVRRKRKTGLKRGAKLNLIQVAT